MQCWVTWTCKTTTKRERMSEEGSSRNQCEDNDVTELTISCSKGNHANGVKFIPQAHVTLPSVEQSTESGFMPCVLNKPPHNVREINLFAYKY